MKKSFLSTAAVLVFHGGYEFTVKVKMTESEIEEIGNKIELARSPPPPKYELPPELQKKKEEPRKPEGGQ
jgi:hypothetical protein